MCRERGRLRPCRRRRGARRFRTGRTLSTVLRGILCGHPSVREKTADRSWIRRIRKLTGFQNRSSARRGVHHQGSLDTHPPLRSGVEFVAIKRLLCTLLCNGSDSYDDLYQCYRRGDGTLQVCRIQIGCRVCPPTTEADRVALWRFMALFASLCGVQRFCRTLSYSFKVSGRLNLRGCHL